MRYFYNIKSGNGTVSDEEGSEHADLQSAKAEAIVAARELMADAILRGKDLSSYTMEIVDEEAQVLVRMPFSVAVQQA